MASMHRVSPSYVVTSFLVLTGTCLKPSPSPQSLPLFPPCMRPLSNPLPLSPPCSVACSNAPTAPWLTCLISLIPSTATVLQRPHHSPPSLPTCFCPTKQASAKTDRASKVTSDLQNAKPLKHISGEGVGARASFPRPCWLPCLWSSLDFPGTGCPALARPCDAC